MEKSREQQLPFQQEGQDDTCGQAVRTETPDAPEAPAQVPVSGLDAISCGCGGSCGGGKRRVVRMTVRKPAQAGRACDDVRTADEGVADGVAKDHAHGRDHGFGEDRDDAPARVEWLGIPRREWIEGAVGLALYAAALLVPAEGWAKTALFAAAWFVFGREVFLGAVRGILAGRWFDEFFLMTVASMGAFLIGEHPEAVAVMLFYRIGEAMQDAAVDRSKDSIRSLMAIRPDTALVLRGEETVSVPPESVSVGDRFMVRPGMRVPVDGKVVGGQSDLDLSALTGESLPVAAGPGMEVLSGTISTNGTLTLEAVRPYAESAVGRILKLVETASTRKARAERFVTRFSKVYTPLVTGAAFLLAVLPPLLVPGADFRTWLYRALVFLVVSCPCALVVSIPLGFYGGIGLSLIHISQGIVR